MAVRFAGSLGGVRRVDGAGVADVPEGVAPTEPPDVEVGGTVELARVALDANVEAVDVKRPAAVALHVPGDRPHLGFGQPESERDFGGGGGRGSKGSRPQARRSASALSQFQP